jgi:hypothetical protein
LGINQPSFTTPLTHVVTSTITASSNIFLGHIVGKICNNTTISSQLSSGTGHFLPSHLNSAMTIAQTLPFQDSIYYTSQNLIGTPLLPREGQSLPPVYSFVSGRVPNPTHISLGLSNPPGGKSCQHPSRS